MTLTTRRAVVAAGILVVAAVSLVIGATRAVAINNLLLGEPGAIRQVTFASDVNQDNILSLGEVVIVHADDSERTYTWGGFKCNNRSLTDVQIQILADTYAAGGSTLTPEYVHGAGSTRCLQAFTLERAPEPDPEYGPIREIVELIKAELDSIDTP